MRLLRKPLRELLGIGLVLSFGATAPLYALNLQNQYHPNDPSRLKQLWFPLEARSLSLNPALSPRASQEAIARRFLQERAATFGLSPDLSELQVVEHKSSLLGSHLRFQQFIGHTPLDGSEIIVSFLNDGRIYQVYNTARALPAGRNNPRLSLEEAFDKAWAWLGVRGRLFEAPKGELRYRVQGLQIKPVYRLELSTTLPYGAWLIEVDAINGQISSAIDQRLSHKSKAQVRRTAPSLARAVDRRRTFANWRTQSLRRAVGIRAQGIAQVFDPDPRTSLGLRTLEDSSDPSAFQPAYQQRVLQDLAFDGSLFHLRGPWVEIVDFDPPNGEPLGSADGNWQFTRGQQGFNEAMTYFHIDQSQRYIQALGFKDQTGILDGPIVADADGANGEDNSYYLPSSQRLAFGHGCVDDNEDADVILHEYAHALHMNINPSWSGGDTGAMGEGFGDYWAASYSLSTPQGANYFPQEVFSWDGQGETDSCWSGRILNASESRYDAARNYEAHAFIEGGFSSDELWSTPLFRSLQDLMALGIAREQVDTIILQAQYGLGAAVKMRDMAQSIVASSRLLYPEGPHATVFTRNFLHHGILYERHPELALKFLGLSDSGGNGAVDPNEDITLQLQVFNSGDLEAQGLKVQLSSSDPSVEMLTAASEFEELGAEQSLETKLSFRTKAESSCGSVLRLAVTLSSNNGPTSVLPLELRVGTSVAFKADATAPLVISDANPIGVSSPLQVDNEGKLTENVQVGISIRHNYKGDLRVTLKSPAGKQVLLHDRTGYSENDINGIYPLSIPPKESLNSLLGEKYQGTWQLIAQDLEAGDEGVLQSWSLGDVSSYSCQ